LRRGDFSRKAGTISVFLLAALGCSLPPEQTIIRDFFAASRLRDLTALSRFATVVFEPRERGTVPEFTIRSVSDERREGDMRVKDVTIVASVNAPDGRVIEKPFVVTLQRPTRTASSAPAGAGSRTTPDLYGGWIVTGVTDAPVSPASRRW
jgi:hypothetical protein